MHLYDTEHNFACNGIVGAGIPHACGAALAAQFRKTGAVAVAEFGDGAANEGSFHESLNLAPILRLERQLGEQGLLDDAAVKAARADAKQQVDAAMTFARNSAYPEAAEAFMHVFAA
jgi:TPP-dependent pyruvate/acetoin dehydrogenase alpha subunit